MSLGRHEARAATADAAVVPRCRSSSPRESSDWTDTFGAARSGGRTHAGQRPDGAEDDAHRRRRRRQDRLAEPHRQALQLQQPSLLQHPAARRRRQRLLLYSPQQRHPRHRRRHGRRASTHTPLASPTACTCRRARSSATWATAATPKTVASHLHFEIHLGGYVAASSGQSRTPERDRPLRQSEGRADSGRVGSRPAAASPTTVTTTPDPRRRTSASTTTTVRTDHDYHGQARDHVDVDHHHGVLGYFGARLHRRRDHRLVLRRLRSGAGGRSGAGIARPTLQALLEGIAGALRRLPGAGDGSRRTGRPDQ